MTLRFGSTPPLDSPAASNPQIEINPASYEFGKSGFVTPGRARPDQSASASPPGRYETATQIDRARCEGGDWSAGDAGQPMKTRGKPAGNRPTVTADFHGVGELRHNIAIPDTRRAVPYLCAVAKTRQRARSRRSPELQGRQFSTDSEASPDPNFSSRVAERSPAAPTSADPLATLGEI